MSEIAAKIAACAGNCCLTVQKSDEIWHFRKFDEQNFDELIVAFREKIGRENFDESLAIRQIRQTFPPSKFCAIR